MAGPNTTLIKTFVAGGAIGEKKLVKMSAGETVVEATDGSAPIIGASLAAIASGARAEIQVAGIASVKAGGNVAIGDYITAGAAGVAVASAPGAGTNSNVAGPNISKTAVSGDEFEILLSPGRIQG